MFTSINHFLLQIIVCSGKFFSHCHWQMSMCLMFLGQMESRLLSSFNFVRPHFLPVLLELRLPACLGIKQSRETPRVVLIYLGNSEDLGVYRYYLSSTDHSWFIMIKTFHVPETKLCVYRQVCSPLPLLENKILLEGEIMFLKEN